MAAGDLRHRVVFDSPKAVDDGYGNTTDGWTEEFEVAAALKPLRGGEDVMAARLGGRQPVVIQVRSSSDTRRITTDWRARNARDGTVYNIRSIADMDGRRAFLDILAEAGVAV